MFVPWLAFPVLTRPGTRWFVDFYMITGVSSARGRGHTRQTISGRWLQRRILHCWRMAAVHGGRYRRRYDSAMVLACGLVRLEHVEVSCSLYESDNRGHTAGPCVGLERPRKLMFC